MLNGLKVIRSVHSRRGPSQSTRVPDLSTPIRDALAPFGLSDRELQVALALMLHLTVSETADRFDLSRSAVGTYRRRLFDKLGVDGECDARVLLESTVGDIDLIPDEAEAACPRLSGKASLGSVCVGISLASIAMHAALLVYEKDSTLFLLKGQEIDLAAALLLVGFLLVPASKCARKKVTAMEYEAVGAACGLLFIIESMRLFSLADGTLSWSAVRYGLSALVWAVTLIGFIGLVFVNVSPTDKSFSLSIAGISGVLALFGYLASWHLGMSLRMLVTVLSVIAVFSTILRLRCLPFILKGGRGRKFNRRWDLWYAGALAGASACFAFTLVGALRTIPLKAPIGMFGIPFAFFSLLIGFARVLHWMEEKLTLASNALLFLTFSTLMIGAGCGIAATRIHAIEGLQGPILAIGVVCATLAWMEARRIVHGRSAFMSLDRPEAVALSLRPRNIELTRTEKLVLAAVADGLDASQIAEQLVVSKSTVNSHLHHAFKKCRVNSLEELRSLLESADDLCCGERTIPFLQKPHFLQSMCSTTAKMRWSEMGSIRSKIW